MNVIVDNSCYCCRGVNYYDEKFISSVFITFIKRAAYCLASESQTKWRPSTYFTLSFNYRFEYIVKH